MCFSQFSEHRYHIAVVSVFKINSLLSWLCFVLGEILIVFSFVMSDGALWNTTLYV